MEQLNKLYVQKLDDIAATIEQSDALATYLEEEDQDSYKALVDEIEPTILDLYQEVSVKEPLQLVSLELALLDDRFEGLFMPKLLGFAILRGEIDSQYRYVRTQEHLKTVLSAICTNSNFELIKNRIGQAIQICFALSSDIWVTNFIDSVTTKKVKAYLLSQKLEKYRVAKDREIGYTIFKKQYHNYHFHTSEFPKNQPELIMQFASLQSFLLERIKINDYNANFLGKLLDCLANKDLVGTQEHISLLGIIINYFELGANDFKKAASLIETTYKANTKFEAQYFEFLEGILGSTLPFDSQCDSRAFKIFDNANYGNVYKYYQIMASIASRGVAHEDSIEAIRLFYSQYEGLSTINECVRLNIYRFFQGFMSGLNVGDYLDYFEINRYIVIYIDGFNNEHFNQKIKEISEKYTNKCLKVYTDKRSKEYQEIKKFIATHFVEMGFMKEKEVTEMFKTKRKKLA